LMVLPASRPPFASETTSTENGRAGGGHGADAAGVASAHEKHVQPAERLALLHAAHPRGGGH
jgi:hypothetical protein